MFSYLEIRLLDNLKYMLHQPLLVHGINCPKWKARESKATEDLGAFRVIEHLVKRTRPEKRTSESANLRKPRSPAEKDRAEMSDWEDLLEEDIKSSKLD